MEPNKNLDKFKNLINLDSKLLIGPHYALLGKDYYGIKNLNKKITPKEIMNSRKQFRKSVIVRNIYSEVLNIIQPIVIKKLKSNTNTQNKKYLNDALLTSIAGISAAMKNTG